MLHSVHFSLAVVVNPTAWISPDTSVDKTRIYHLCSLGRKLPKDTRKEILELLAQVRRRLNGEGEDSYQVRSVPSNDIEAIARKVTFKEVAVRLARYNPVVVINHRLYRRLKVRRMGFHAATASFPMRAS